jgi:hypothetical protein
LLTAEPPDGRHPVAHAQAAGGNQIGQLIRDLKIQRFGIWGSHQHSLSEFIRHAIHRWASFFPEQMTTGPIC